MKRGDTFLMGSPNGKTKHFYIVISDPAKHAGSFVAVNVTTPDPKADQSCMILPAEHKWLKYPSPVNFGDALHITLLDAFAKLVAIKKILPQDPVSAAVAERIVKAAQTSPAMPKRFLPMLK